MPINSADSVVSFDNLFPLENFGAYHKIYDLETRNGQKPLQPFQCSAYATRCYALVAYTPKIKTRLKG